MYVCDCLRAYSVSIQYYMIYDIIINYTSETDNYNNSLYTRKT